jgi:hypothetical protein
MHGLQWDYSFPRSPYGEVGHVEVGKNLLTNDYLEDRERVRKITLRSILGRWFARIGDEGGWLRDLTLWVEKYPIDVVLRLKTIIMLILLVLPCVLNAQAVILPPDYL